MAATRRPTRGGPSAKATHKKKKDGGGGGGASASTGPTTPAAGSPARPSKQACGVGGPHGASAASLFRLVRLGPDGRPLVVASPEEAASVVGFLFTCGVRAGEGGRPGCSPPRAVFPPTAAGPPLLPCAPAQPAPALAAPSRPPSPPPRSETPLTSTKGPSPSPSTKAGAGGPCGQCGTTGEEEGERG